MKALLIGIVLMSSGTAFSNDVVLTAKGCSLYPKEASRYRHEESMTENFRENAFKKCNKKGFEAWNTLVGKLTTRCYKAQIKCHNQTWKMSY